MIKSAQDLITKCPSGNFKKFHQPAKDIKKLTKDFNEKMVRLAAEGYDEKKLLNAQKESKKLKDLEEKLKLVFQPDQIERMNNPKVANNKKWSSLTLQQCLQLYLILGPAGYNFLRKERNYPAPGVSTLQFYMSKIGLTDRK